MDFIIYYFVSIVNCYISVLIIFDYFKTNFSLSYEKQLIYSFSSILIALIIGSINLLEIRWCENYAGKIECDGIQLWHPEW